ncbi:hypothetical protein T03_9915 [Trichinella britovi]|uniref:Uncharacterized protein n=1 Tax=Trichinella britovi TaxID=45882 RepID=A0A0V1CDB9_TRIBR|nr:hypothetical protein T03_9915 [Trichinella britovi]
MSSGMPLKYTRGVDPIRAKLRSTSHPMASKRESQGTAQKCSKGDMSDKKIRGQPNLTFSRLDAKTSCINEFFLWTSGGGSSSAVTDLWVIQSGSSGHNMISSDELSSVREKTTERHKDEWQRKE